MHHMSGEVMEFTVYYGPVVRGLEIPGVIIITRSARLHLLRSTPLTGSTTASTGL